MFNKRSLIGFLIIVIMTLHLTACSELRLSVATNSVDRQEYIDNTPALAASDASIYFSTREETTVSVWKTNLDGQASVIFTLPARFPVHVLPAQELALLSDCSNPNSGCTLPDIYLNYNLDYLQLSPDGRFLVWRGAQTYCPGTGCAGLEQIELWKLNKWESQTLLEIPLHINLNASQDISDISWSPDSRHIGYIHSSHEYGWSVLRVMDINSKEIADVGMDALHFAWSPTGDRIAYIALRDQDMVVVVKSLDGSTLIMLEDEWQKVSDIDWSPDGMEIAVTATQNGEWQLYVADLTSGEIRSRANLQHGLRFITADWCPKGAKIILAARSDWEVTDNQEMQKQKVYIFDIETGNIVDVQISDGQLFDVSNPQWSPGGRVLGVNLYNPGEQLFSKGVAVIDSENGTVLTKLIMEDMDTHWLWSSEGDALLVKLEKVNRSCTNADQRGIGIYYWTVDELMQIPFHPRMIDGFQNCTLDLVNVIW